MTRGDELRPGIPQIREVLDVEGEVNRLSCSGWIAVLWPRMPPPSEALDLLLLAVGKAARDHSYKQTPRWTPDKWLRAAKALLDDGRIPIPAGFGHELTLRRLTRWIEPQARALVMGVCEPNRDSRDAEIVGEWFSQAAEAGCLILTPRQPTSATLRKAPTKPPPTAFRSEAERTLFEALERDESFALAASQSGGSDHSPHHRNVGIDVAQRTARAGTEKQGGERSGSGFRSGVPSP